MPVWTARRRRLAGGSVPASGYVGQLDARSGRRAGQGLAGPHRTTMYACERRAKVRGRQRCVGDEDRRADAGEFHRLLLDRRRRARTVRRRRRRLIRSSAARFEVVVDSLGPGPRFSAEVWAGAAARPPWRVPRSRSTVTYARAHGKSSAARAGRQMFASSTPQRTGVASRARAGRLSERWRRADVYGAARADTI